MKEVDEEIKAIKADQKMEGEFMVFATNYMDDMRTLEEEKTELISVIVEKEQVIEEKEQVIEEKEQALVEKEQALVEKEQALRKEQEEKKAILINLLKKFDNSSISEINGMTVEEVAKLRVELLGW